eukprot:TRINITY_DN1816_c0_g1_i1.p1 TRINITY_DN1816_c0_g1~~TRINITY_DN1816_c0_g1_i1.p1  ORF type:complete len:724 (+),score=156.85 TRINITY_DN1816_c0_g1_i1:388-2559(+)
MKSLVHIACITIVLLALCLQPGQAQSPSPAAKPDPSADPSAPSPEDVAKAVSYIEGLLEPLMEKTVASSMADWNKQTNITTETSLLAQKASADLLNFTSAALRNISDNFRPIIIRKMLPQKSARLYYLLKISQVLPPPRDPQDQVRLAHIAQEMENIFSRGQWCHIEDGHKVCRDLDGLNEILASSNDPTELLQAWLGWRQDVGPKLRQLFPEFVELANKGAKDVLEFKDMASAWQRGYDMPEEEFVNTIDKLWDQVKPLYEQLHCYTRHKLATYPAYAGKDIVKDGFDQFIPAHILGDMWGQNWINLWSILDPNPGGPVLDATDQLKHKNVTEIVGIAESFFTSLGFDPLPQTFWQRSLFEKPPPPREVVCHASAWDVTFKDDLRLKACFKKTEADLITAHHELGHLYYFHEYNDKNVLYQNGANDGFHEAIGDTISLSVTPKYLASKGLLKNFKEDDTTLNALMKRALSKVAFLPFGLVVDKWRWDVFHGKVKPDDYNDAWWLYKQQYQGVMAPIKRDPKVDFDPGAKYHVAANVPYIRYFLAAILQFQFHEALCKEAGHTGPLYSCSIYNSKAAGTKLKKMLRLGASKPWQDALFEIAGTREIDATPLLNYFAPLSKWLAKQNGDRKLQCGWPIDAPVEPQNVETHMGKFVAIAVGCVIAIFIIGVITNYYQKAKGHHDDNIYEPVGVDAYIREQNERAYPEGDIDQGPPPHQVAPDDRI